MLDLHFVSFWFGSLGFDCGFGDIIHGSHGSLARAWLLRYMCILVTLLVRGCNIKYKPKLLKISVLLMPELAVICRLKVTIRAQNEIIVVWKCCIVVNPHRFCE